MKISVVCPLRPRWPNGFKAMIEALCKTTSEPKSVEVFVKIDHNDKESIAIADSLSVPFSFRYILMDGLWGRMGIPEYTNTLAWNSKGSLIWWISDEVRVLTPGWDDILWERTAEWRDKPAVFFPFQGTFYPIITRKFIEVVGRFTAHIALDSFLNQISGPLRHHKIFPLKDIPIKWAHASAANDYSKVDHKTPTEYMIEPMLRGELQERVKYDPFQMELDDPRVKTIFREVSQALLNYYGVKDKPWW